MRSLNGRFQLVFVSSTMYRRIFRWSNREELVRRRRLGQRRHAHCKGSGSTIRSTSPLTTAAVRLDLEHVDLNFLNQAKRLHGRREMRTGCWWGNHLQTAAFLILWLYWVSVRGAEGRLNKQNCDFDRQSIRPCEYVSQCRLWVHSLALYCSCQSGSVLLLVAVAGQMCRQPQVMFATPCVWTAFSERT